MVSAMLAIQRHLENGLRRSDDGAEYKFLSTSLQTLATASRHAIEAPQNGVVSSFEVELDHHIGSGGL